MNKLIVFLSTWIAIVVVPLGQEVAFSQTPQVTPTTYQSPQPPSDSPVLLHNVQLSFPTQGNVSMVDAQTYLSYMEIRNHVSRPSDEIWTNYDEAIERVVLQDFKRLWGTGFLDDIWIDVVDDPFENGVAGKRIVFNLEELERVKIVAYTGSEELDRSDIDERLQQLGIVVRLDTFLDPGVINQVEAVLRQMFTEEGYQFAEISHEITPVAGGPKLVHLTFNMLEGPKVHIEQIDFIGNVVMDEGTLKGKMSDTKERWFFSWLTGRGLYSPEKFEGDAEKIIEHYRNNGYIAAQVGQPELEYGEQSLDGKDRPVRLIIPVSEGERHVVGNVSFDGNDVVASEAMSEILDLKVGEYYNEEDVRDGLQEAREIYGSLGYYEFTAFPDLQLREDAEIENETNDTQDAYEVASVEADISEAPVVDVTIRVQEGGQYFVNQITFNGNMNTHDIVIRRELRLVENGVFNTDALQYSLRRLNQLGFFEPLEETDILVENLENTDDSETEKVDVTFNFAEQNLNSLTFGAGVSQWDGFFVQTSFQTRNFRGRGESLNFQVMHGQRAKNYQISFNEPFLFGRPMLFGVDVYRRDYEYIGQFTTSSLGSGVTYGLPVADFTRVFLGYSYENTRVKEVNPLYFDPEFIGMNPYFQDALLVGEGGRRTISKITPSISHDTVDHPIFPTMGRKFIASIDLAGFGGDTKFYKPSVEAIQYIRHTSRTTIGLRGQIQFIKPYAGTTILPIFERLFLGGEYSVRGYDIQTIGPRDEGSGLILGGTKSLLFNAEYMINIAGPLRLVFFYDAGQVRDKGEKFNFARDGFVTSTGAEIRFFMPVLNMPFRLIYARNLNSRGVLDNRYRQTAAGTFKFAVGTTF